MPSSDRGLSAPLRILFGIAAFIIVVAGLKAAQDLIVPFLVALFIAVIANVPMSWMRRNRVPFIIALVLMLASIIGVMVFIGGYLGTSIADLTAVIPQYENRLNSRFDSLLGWVNSSFGTNIGASSIYSVLEPSSVLRYVTLFFNSASGLLTNATLIILYVAFMLAEADTLPDKANYIFRGNSTVQLESFQRMARSVNQYLGLKTLISAMTGLFIAIWLLIVGVEFPYLWGFIAFLLNFIPSIGSIIAAIPAILMALVQLGLPGAAWTLIGYLIANLVMGNIVEPRVMGRSLGLSVFVVIISLIFWGWVLGPVGMFLSVPLTLAIQILLQGSPNTRWLSVLIGNAPPKD